MDTGTDGHPRGNDRFLPNHASLAKDDPPDGFVLYAGEDRFANEPDTRPNLHIVLNFRKLRDPDILADRHVIPHYHVHVNTCAVAKSDIISQGSLAADEDVIPAPEPVADKDIAKDNAVPANRGVLPQLNTGKDLGLQRSGRRKTDQGGLYHAER